MNTRGASAGCRTAHHHHYYHHHHGGPVTRPTNHTCYHESGDYGGGGGGGNASGGGSQLLMNRTMDSLNYWKRAFDNPEQMSGLGERMIRLGGPPAGGSGRSSSANGGGGGTAQPPVHTNGLFTSSKERKVSTSRSRCIRTSTSAAKLQLLKTLSPIQNSPQFLESPIAAMARKSSEAERLSRAGDENSTAVAPDCYKYGIEDLTDTDDVGPPPPLLVTNGSRGEGLECLDSELETDDVMPAPSAADKRRKVSPKRKVAESTRSQLESAGGAPPVGRQRMRRDTGNGQRSTVIGIAEYYEGADYALPVNGFFKPSVMMYNNHNSNHNNYASNRRKTSHNSNNNTNTNVYGDRDSADSFNLSQKHNNINNNSGLIDDSNNSKSLWKHVNNNNISNKNSGQNNNSNALRRQALPLMSPVAAGGGACAFAAHARTGTNAAGTNSAAAADAPTARPSTGIYDDEDGTLVFAIEI